MLLAPCPGSQTIPQGNLLLDKLASVDVEIVDVPFGPELDVVKYELAEKLKREGMKPYIVASPPRSTALAAVAFTWCIAEIAQQQQHLGIDANWIYTASVGGTQAGLVLGTKALALKMKPFGIAPIRWENKLERLRAAANSAADLLGLNTHVTDADIQNTDDYIGQAYGYLTPDVLMHSNSSSKQRAFFSTPSTPLRRWHASLTTFNKANWDVTTLSSSYTPVAPPHSLPIRKNWFPTYNFYLPIETSVALGAPPY